MVGVLFAACSALVVTPSPALNTAPSLGISNGTTLAVTLVVNGAVVGTFAPGARSDPIAASLPGLPWAVQVRSPSGRLLTSMTVRVGDVWQTTGPDGGVTMKGDGMRVDLSCGRLDIWSGPPMLGPPPGPGTPGDCAP